MSKIRTARLDGEFRRALGETLHTDIKDPRISPMASVSRVETTPDLKYAKVYVSVYDTDERRQSTIAALTGAAGFLRTKLSDKLSVRRIPELRFILDESIEYSVYISKLIDEVSEKDRASAHKAAEYDEPSESGSQEHE